MDKSRITKARCSVCGRELDTPNLFSQKDRDEVLKSFCPSSTVLFTQWLIHHGWHVSKSDNIYYGGSFFCPDCFPKGLPEYSGDEIGKEWCVDAERWMREM